MFNGVVYIKRQSKSNEEYDRIVATRGSKVCPAVRTFNSQGLASVAVSSRHRFRCFPSRHVRIKHVPSFSFGFQQGQDVVDLDGTLDVSDNGSRGVVHEFDSDLGDTTSGTGSAQDLGEGRNMSVLVSAG